MFVISNGSKMVMTFLLMLPRLLRLLLALLLSCSFTRLMRLSRSSVLLLTNTATQRVFISAVAASTPASHLCSSLRATQRKFQGAFIASIDDAPAFAVAQAQCELSRLRSDAVSAFGIAPALEPVPTYCSQAAALDELDLLQRLAPSEELDSNDLALTMDSL
jgi:hypothetical protein